MDEWLVRLKGDEFDLEWLSALFRSADRSVKKDEDGYYYIRCSDLNEMADSDAVRERALRTGFKTLPTPATGLNELWRRASTWH